MLSTVSGALQSSYNMASTAVCATASLAGRVAFSNKLHMAVGTVSLGYGLLSKFYWNPYSEKQQRCLDEALQEYGKNSHSGLIRRLIFTKSQGEILDGMVKALNRGLDDETEPLKSPALAKLKNYIETAETKLTGDEANDTKVMQSVKRWLDAAIFDGKRTQRTMMAAGAALLSISCYRAGFVPFLR